MSEDVTILRLDDRERWEAEHRQDGLPSQSWGYAWGLSASGFDPKLAVVRSKGARMLLPFFERSFMGTTDIATIPGLSGASIEPNSSAPLALWREFAIEQNWIAGYIQLASAATFDLTLPDSELVAHNTVFVFDLHAWDIYKSVTRKFRKAHLYEGKRRGAILVDDRPALAERLRTLYPEAMRRLGASQVFSAPTIERWTGDAATYALGAKVGDTIEAIHFGYVAGKNAEWHIAATSEHGRGLGAWIVWNAILRLKEKDVRMFNIGGGGRVGDGLYRFKERFNVEPIPMRSLRQIYDRRRYDELCELAGMVTGETWFPAYRAKRL
jgi:hypothetical protein